MKKVKVTLLAATLLFTTITVKATEPKVKINHKGNVIEVSIFALPAHLLHGDTLVDDGGDDGCLDC